MFALLAGAQDVDLRAVLDRQQLYVHPDAEQAVDADALRAKIRSSGAYSVGIAIMPDGSTADAQDLIPYRQRGGSRTYVVLAGSTLTAASRYVGIGIDEPAQIAAAHPGDVQAALEDLIARVGERERALPIEPPEPGGLGFSPFGVFIYLLLFVFAAVFAVGAYRGVMRFLDDQ